MAGTNGIEAKLDEALVKKAPFQIPENAKKVIVEWIPWLNLVFGLFALWGAYSLWNWAHTVNQLANYVNSFAAYYGGSTVVKNHLTATVYVSLAVLAAEAVLYIAAFPGTRAKKKSGWNLMYYAVLLNAVYGLVLMFTDYGGVGNFIGYLIGTVIGLYILFQLRSHYMGGVSKATEKK